MKQINFFGYKESEMLPSSSMSTGSSIIEHCSQMGCAAKWVVQRAVQQTVQCVQFTNWSR